LLLQWNENGQEDLEELYKLLINPALKVAITALRKQGHTSVKFAIYTSRSLILDFL
jgi:hypothetical protein